MDLVTTTPIEQINEAIKRQESARLTKPLASYQSRVEVLKKLKQVIGENKALIIRALQEDLGKSEFEAVIAEIDFVLSEIKHSLKSLKKWMRPKKVGTPWVLMPARSYILSEPLGRILIIAPWNYPFQLLFSPLVGALAAGNQVLLKPSELAPKTAEVATKIIIENFDPRLISVVNGGVDVTTHVLDKKFDHIFYTGNGHVGRIIMQKAAQFLTPVTLELGGKSPCVIAGNPDIVVTARRIAWGKWFNAGQTCVAPDYIIIEKHLYDDFMVELKKAIVEFYGSDLENSSDYGRIINERHFNRLMNLFSQSEVLIGGENNKDLRFIAPTVIKANFNHQLMQDEIFGPILPVIVTDSFSEAVGSISRRDHPLAAYVFSDRSDHIELFTQEVHAGGVGVNECLMHLSNPELPFGGVGPSGMGAYHGEHSFNLFSHKKSVLRRYFIFDLKLRYPPYKGKLAILSWLMRLLS